MWQKLLNALHLVLVRLLDKLVGEFLEVMYQSYIDL